MMIRLLGKSAAVAAVIGMLGELFALQLPTLRWPFNTSREMPMLSSGAESWPEWLTVDGQFLWFGWLFYLVLFGVGIFLIRSFPPGRQVPPMVRRRWQRFRSVGRGFWSFIVMLVL